MPITVLMPALSPTMEEGTLAKWLVEEGQDVAPGDVIAEIETDKATMEVESVDEGRLGKILIPAGSQGVKVNKPIAIILANGETMKDVDVRAINSAPAQTPSQDVSAPTMVNAVAAPDVPMPRGGKTPPSLTPQPSVPEAERPAGTKVVAMTVREALCDAMAEEMRGDERVFVMGEEVGEYEGAYKVTQGLLAEFGAERVIDTPITEHGFAGLGVGAAFGGLKPVVEFMTFNFAMQAIDHIVNSAAKTLYMSGGQMSCPIVFRGPNGAASRVAAQHSQDYSSWYAHIPGLKVIAPYSAGDAKGLLKAAIRDPNPVIFLENEILYGHNSEVPERDDWVLPIGKAHIVREGGDVTIVSYSIGVHYALEAAGKLAGDGIEAEIIDLRTLRPLDTDTVVASVKKTNRCVVAHEGWPVCSMASEIAVQLMEKAFDWLDAPVMRATGKDVPMPYAANLEKLALLSADDIVEAARKVLYV